MIKDTTQWKKLTDKLQVNFSNPNDEDVDHFFQKLTLFVVDLVVCIKNYYKRMEIGPTL